MVSPYDVLSSSALKHCPLSQADRDTIISLYKSNGQQAIYDFSIDRRIAPFVAILLSKLGLDTLFWDGIAAEYRKRNYAVIRCLDSVFGEFTRSGVRKAFVTENFGALLASDSDRALFASGDVDIYADIREREGIYRAFERLGYVRKERHSYNRLISTNFYNDDVLPQGFYFAVAWNPLSRTKLPCFVEADDFVEWNKLWKYNGTAICLPNIDALMYICLLHISLHSFSRAPDIRLYTDIGNLSRLPVDWMRIVRFAQRDNTVVRVLVSCILAKELLCVDIPDYVLGYQASFSRQISSLLGLVYNSRGNCLVYEPRGLKVLRIEAMSHDQGFCSGIASILFPNKEWVRESYVGERGNLIVGYLKHLRNLLAGVG